jgi:hypothetical protein
MRPKMLGDLWARGRIRKAAGVETSERRGGPAVRIRLILFEAAAVEIAAGVTPGPVVVFRRS